MSNQAAQADARDKRLPSRALVFVLAAVGAAIVGLIALLQVFAVQRIPELTEARLEAAQQLWAQRGPVSYDMEIELRGAQPGSIRIEVREGEPVAMTRDGRSPPPRTWDVWSVRGMFDTLERELELAEDPQHEMDAAAGTQLQLRGEFDPQWGFPRRYHRFASGGAPEVFWRVTRFEVQ